MFTVTIEVSTLSQYTVVRRARADAFMEDWLTAFQRVLQELPRLVNEVCLSSLYECDRLNFSVSVHPTVSSFDLLAALRQIGKVGYKVDLKNLPADELIEILPEIPKKKK